MLWSEPGSGGRSEQRERVSLSEMYTWSMMVAVVEVVRVGVVTT